jgi:hypothetical protein
MATKTSKGGRRDQSSAFSSSGKKSPGKSSGGGKKGRPAAPVKVGRDRNWGPIIMFIAVGVIAVLIIGYAFWTQRSSGDAPWQERAADIEGMETFDTSADWMAPTHVAGPLQYDVLPPVGGHHNDRWQNCSGVVYDAQIANEHAVHGLEHGAVWITYEPSLPQDQVDQLADLVDGADFTFMSPFPGLDAPISLQAWGYQLKVESAGDDRIRDFIRTLRNNAAQEPGATCGGPSAVTTTGTAPVDSGQGM